MTSTAELRSCVHIVDATTQPDPQERNAPRNQERNSPRKPASLLGVIRNRKRNQNATSSCALPLTTPSAMQPSCARKFAELVRAYGADWGFLFDVETILAEMDQADTAELENMETHQKQSWAQMLAYRLSAERMQHCSSALAKRN